MARFVQATQGTITHHINVDAVTHLEVLPNGTTMVHFIGREKGLHVDAKADQIVARAKNLE